LIQGGVPGAFVHTRVPGVFVKVGVPYSYVQVVGPVVLVQAGVPNAFFVQVGAPSVFLHGREYLMHLRRRDRVPDIYTGEGS
jgi:hypothetical protein